jgi:hypothetical protein
MIKTPIFFLPMIEENPIDHLFAGEPWHTLQLLRAHGIQRLTYIEHKTAV